jgi:uncharacterized protein YdaU (DUF1376 family)
MAKQPYIPLYTGDYLKDTRRLPLEARGAWVDILIFMWENKERGVLIGTMEEFAQMMSCTLTQANFVIGLLQQKTVCDFEVLKNGQIKLSCRRMIRDAETSEKRAQAGKKGMSVRYEEDCYNKQPNKTPNKSVTSSDIDNDIEYEDDIEFKLKEALNEIYLDQEQIKWPHLDFAFELETFRNKVRGSPHEYRSRDNGGFRLAFQYQLRNSKGKPKKNATTKNDRTDFLNDELAIINNHVRKA